MTSLRCRVGSGRSGSENVRFVLQQRLWWHRFLIQIELQFCSRLGVKERLKSWLFISSVKWLWSRYCWWLKSCTTWDVWNPINNGKNYLPTGAGFQPSTVVPCIFMCQTFPSPTFFCRNSKGAHIEMSWSKCCRKMRRMCEEEMIRMGNGRVGFLLRKIEGEKKKTWISVGFRPVFLVNLQ